MFLRQFINCKCMFLKLKGTLNGECTFIKPIREEEGEGGRVGIVLCL